MLLSLFVVSGPPRSIVYGPPFSPLCRESIESLCVAIFFLLFDSLILSELLLYMFGPRGQQYRVTQYKKEERAQHESINSYPLFG